LNKRPNVRLVETGLPFGVDGFTSYMGKQFDARMKMTKRYYPHTYNVDGFFVSKFKKFGPTVGAKTNGAGGVGVHGVVEDVTMDDKAPIEEDEKVEDAFGGWDDEEDEAYINKAKRRALRRKGIDPKAKRAAKEGEKKG